MIYVFNKSLIIKKLLFKTIFILLITFILFLAPYLTAFGATRSGESLTSTNNGTGTRFWKVTTDTAKSNSNASDATEDENFELSAGGSITLKMLETTTGTLPPDSADTLTFEVREENGSTVTQSFTWSAGNTVSFSPSEAGTYRVYIRAELSGVGAYDVNSDSDDNRGYLRAGTTLSESNDANAAKAAYPDTVISTLTLGHTPNSSKSITINFRQSGSSVVSESVSDTDTTFAKSDAIDNTYASSETDVDIRAIFGNSDSDWTGVPWTHLTSLPAGFSQVGSGSITAVEKSGAFTADPRVYFSSDGSTSNNTASTTQSVYNRGETVNYDFYILNSRSEQQAGSFTVVVQDDDLISEDSQSKSGALYSGSYVVASGDKATNDTSGSPKTFKITATGVSKISNNAHSVSSKYFIDAHPELDSTLNKDTFDDEDANETTIGIIASDVFSFFAHVMNVRKDTEIDTSGSAITFTLKDPDSTTIETSTTDTDSDGWTSNYDYALTAPGGDWSITAAVSTGGNTGTDSETLTFVSPYAGNYAIDKVGWNQTYDIGDTATFTIQTLSKASGSYTAVAADAAPTYRLRYWDGALWQELASGSMTALAATGTYEITYAIPNDSAWIGRKIAISFDAAISGTSINASEEIEVVGSPAQVIIQEVSDTTIPTISADIRITNEGTAQFEYTYEYCIVTTVGNECGGGDDAAYGSAAKLIQPGNNFDTTLTLNITDAGDYFFKAAVWWSNQSSKSSKSFTATEVTSSSSGGGGGGGAVTSVVSQTDVVTIPIVYGEASFAAVWRRISEMLVRMVNFESRLNRLESRVIVLERKVGLGGLPVQQVIPRQNIQLPKITPKLSQHKKVLFRIRFH